MIGDIEMKHKVSARKGFTLIELMVVILIIGILAALIVPRVIGNQAIAKENKAKADLSTLTSMLANFRLDNGRYPTEQEGLNALMQQPSDCPNWKGPYSQRPLPEDPWGHDYVYTYPGSGGDDSYTVESYGSDGAPGGTGEAADLVDGDIGSGQSNGQ